jgi:hypothetical protein
MTKKELLNEIKRMANQTYSEVMLLYYKGENVACIEIPAKRNFETMSEYMERYEITPRGKGKYLLTINFGYDGSISVLIDNFGGV